MKCIFFGSPDFAVASLEALLNSKHEVLGVITQPDRPSGRGLKLESPAVKKLALTKNLPILQPEKINTEETYRWLKEKSPDILVVVAYGEFLGEKLLSFCRTPPVNVHPSLLPELRGAAPMQWALLHGLTATGVSTQYMVKEMDAGDVLLQESVSIDTEENAKELQDRLKKIGGDLLVETLTKIEDGTIKPQKQNSNAATFAPLLTKEDGRILWSSAEAKKIHDQIRGLFPWPGAYTYFSNKRIKILRSRCTQLNRTPGPAGRFFYEKEQLFVQCLNEFLEILELQPEGKRPMLPAEFMSGMKSSEASALQFHSFMETP